MANEDKSRIERLKQKLYSPTADIHPRERTILKPIENDLPKEFNVQNNEPDPWNLPKKKMGAFAKIFIASFVFFLVALGFGFYMFSRNVNTAVGSVDLKVIGPVQIGGGEPLSFDIVMENKSSSALEAIDLVIEYPDGTKKSDDLKQDLKEERIYIGDLASKATLKKTFSAALFGDEGTSKSISARIEYHLPGSFTLFQKTKTFEVALTAAPITVTVEGLKEISAGQPLELTVNLTSNSNSELDNIYLVAEYPFGFIIDTTSEAPSESNNVWKFDKLAPKETKIIKIKGALEGQNEELRGFRISAGTRDTDVKEGLSVILSSFLHETLIKKSFVTLVIKTESQSDPTVAVQHDDSINGEIIITNNTNDPIKNVTALLGLTGQSFSKFSVQPEKGFYNSAANSIEWSEKTDPELTNLGPQRSYSAKFVFETKNLSLIENIQKNPKIILDGVVRGKRITGENLEEQIEIKTIKTLKLISPIKLSVKTFYYSGPLQNTGPIPPKVETETTYSMKLEVTNPINSILGTKVTFNLPLYVSWKDQISGNEKVSYDPTTRKVVWDLGTVEDSVGYVKPSRTLWFKIGVFPSANQSGTVPTLLEDVTLTGKDEFTGSDLRTILKPPTTKLSDAGAISTHDTVTQ